MKFARANAKEHVEVAPSMCGFSFELGDVADILELGFGFPQIGTSLTTETAQNIASFFLTTDLGKPPRRFGEEPDD